MYPETTQYLKKIEDELKNHYHLEYVDLVLLNNIEHILFESWNDGYLDGFSSKE